MNVREFARNCESHTMEELAPHEDHHVAWSKDGKLILASALELADLYKELDRKAITEYVIGYVPRFDEE
jgi:hypothetical protein